MLFGGFWGVGYFGKISNWEKFVGDFLKKDT